MTKTLVILESKNKVSKVQGFLGNDYIVTASYGHVRELPHKSISIDIENGFNPNYQVSESKKQIVANIKKLFKNNGKTCDVLLACDYDREGESISWHLAEILKIKKQNRKRLLFTEITKKAVLQSIKNPTPLDMNMVYAQQARRVLDRLIGYIITPILWKHIQSSYKKNNSLSAGRVQSVVLKLIIERENDIKKHTSKSSFKIDGNFILMKDSKSFKAELNKELNDKEKVKTLLEQCNTSKFSVSDIKLKKTKRSAKPPFITSSLQQEASNLFKMSPKVTMTTAQNLFTAGYITYIRTDSLTLSEDAKKNIETFIVDNFGEEYHKNKDYKNKGDNCQEAHEAIRPCNIDLKSVNGDDSMTPNENKLYKLIWERTIMSQMTDAKVEIKTTLISGDKIPTDYHFIYKNEKITFDGFLKAKSNSNENENSEDETSLSNKNSVIEFKKNSNIDNKKFTANEKFSKPSHLRYTEASLIKKLDDLGIGRPSTYASMISIVQDRNYVEKKDLEGKTIEGVILEISKNKSLKEKIQKIKMGSEKQKLVPTNIGDIVNTFMTKHFSSIIDYSYTSKIETQLDKIAKGKIQWDKFIKVVYDDLYGTSDILMREKQLEKAKHRRVLGKYPNTQNDVVCYIGKYGPCIQYKSNFSPLGDIKIDEITLEQALEMLKYPKKIGRYEGEDVILKKGKYGVYIVFNGKNYSINKDSFDYSSFKLANAIDIINYQKKPQSNIIKKIGDIVIKNGPYGPYINYKNKNIKIFNKNPNDLTEAECRDIITKSNTKKYKK